MIDTELAPEPFPFVEVFATRTILIVVERDADLEEWTTFLPMPGARCSDCSRPVQRAEECALSGLCLRCLCGPPAPPRRT